MDSFLLLALKPAKVSAVKTNHWAAEGGGEDKNELGDLGEMVFWPDTTRPRTARTEQKNCPLLSQFDSYRGMDSKFWN